MKIKISQSKERNTIAKQSQLSSLSSSIIKITKDNSKHTNLSTNFTSHSIHLNCENKKNQKQKTKEIQPKQKKQKTIRQKQSHNLIKSKKLKENIKNKKSCDFQRQKFYNFQQQGAISYRQYCLVQNSFVPVVSNHEHKKLEDIMRSTADTTYRLSEFNRTTFRKVFPFKLKEEEQYVSRTSENSEIIFKKERKVSKRQVQIDASPFYEQIGIQYSQRTEFKQTTNLKYNQLKAEPQNKYKIGYQNQQNFSQKNQTQLLYQDQQKFKVVQIDVQTDEIICYQSPIKTELLSPNISQEQQSLSDLLLKLQFKHLPSQKSFKNLSKNQKQHYSQLLTSLISKLNQSPRQIEKNHIKSKQEIQIQEIHLIPLEQIKIKYQALEMQIYKRQSCQMNWIQNINFLNYNQDAIDTSLMAVNSFLVNFFCYIELNYVDNFLLNIKKQFGPSFYDEFLKFTRGGNSEIKKVKVLDSFIFNQFCDQLSQISECQKIHLCAVFDYINNLLDFYRPGYHHGGEPFPWSTKMYTNMCEYVIDEDSLQVIFIQIKQTIEKSLSYLCGLIVEERFYKDITQINPLSIKKQQRQSLLIQGWLSEKNNQNHQLECQATKVLYQISQQIQNKLLLQILGQIPLCRQLF